MSKRRPRPAPPSSKAEALARVARQVRSLKHRLESSARRADDAVRESAGARRELTGAQEQQAAVRSAHEGGS